MTTSVGQIGLDLVINSNGFKKQMSGITGLAKKAALALAAAFSVKKLVDFGKSCLELGSDLAEVQNVVDVTFPNMTAQVDEFARSAITSAGLSETMAKQFTGTFGAMAKAFGFSEQQAYDMSTSLTQLAGDVASFYNLSQEEAYTKLKSVFTGETESLKDLGVVMTQTALDSYALANGFGKTTSAMSEAEKVALRYQFVQEQLSAASGDFARTSDSWANQVRILKLQVDSLKATIGQGLINLFTPIIKTVNTLIGKLGTLANAFKAFTELITGNKSSGSSGIADMGAAATEAGSGLENASGAADNVASSAKKAGNAAKKAASQMRALMGFDQINKLPEQTDSSGDADTGNSGSSSGGIGSAVDFGSLAQGATVIDEVDSKFTKLFKNIKRLCEPAIKSLKRLWSEGLARLGTFTWTALKDFYKGFLVPVGKWVMGTGIPRFLDALNNGLMKVDFPKINVSLKTLWDVLTPFGVKVGEGLLWFWENVLVPLGTWTANEVVPRFLKTISTGIQLFNAVLTALQPLFQWFWSKVLQPLAKWTGEAFLTAWDAVNSALQGFSDWCETNPGVIEGITITVAAFFAAWKTTELLSFIEQSGGVIAALGRIGTALLGTTAAKIADKAETLILNAMYAGDFVAALASSTAALVKQAAQLAINTAAKLAEAAAQGVMTAATAVWEGVCVIATTATIAFGAAVSFLMSPIGIAVVAITALIAVGVLLYKNWDVVKEKCAELRDWIIEKTEALRDGAVQAFETLKTNVTEALQVLAASIREKWNAICSWFEKILKKIQEFFSGLWKGIKETFANVGDWFKGKFELAYRNVTQAFSNAKTFFGDVWRGIKDSFGNIAEWFQDKFSRAWQAVKDVFSSGGQVFEGIKEGILDSLRSVINGLISGINSVVSVPFNGINSVLNNLRNVSIAGKHPFSWLPTISTPQIPYLAQGGFVEKNTPQLAMIGDNRHQGEVVAPEDKLRQMAMEAVRAAAGSGGITKEELELIINNAVLRIVAALRSLAFFVDSEELAKAVMAGMESIDGRYNPVKFV